MNTTGLAFRLALVEVIRRSQKSDSFLFNYMEFCETQIFFVSRKQGYTHDACRSPAAVFTKCAQFRARLSARPRKRVVGPPAPPPELKFAG